MALNHQQKVIDDDEESYGSYVQPEKFIKMLRKEIQDLTDFLSDNKASDVEAYRHTTGKIMGMKKALEVFINKKR